MFCTTSDSTATINLVLQSFNRILIGISFFIIIICLIFLPFAFLLTLDSIFHLAVKANFLKYQPELIISLFQFFQWLLIIFLINYKSVVIAQIPLHCSTCLCFLLHEVFFNQHMFIVHLLCARDYFKLLDMLGNKSHKRPLILCNMTKSQMQYPLAFRTFSPWNEFSLFSKIINSPPSFSSTGGGSRDSVFRRYISCILP